MPVATPSKVRAQIDAGNPDPIYLLVGDDEVEKSALAGEFADLVDEGLRAFNVERIHAGEMTTGERLADGVGAIVAAARTLPMMSPRRVVVVSQADALLMPKRESEAAARALDEFEKLLNNPEPLSVLVLVTGALDRRSRLYKLLLKQATVVECGAIADQADAERWVKNRVAAAGGQIDPAATRLIAQRAGTDVQRLRGDVDRLLLYTLGKKSVTADDVRELVGPAALQDDWALTNAIEAGQGGEALRQMALLVDAGAAPEKVLGQLGWLVRSKFPVIAPSRLAAAVDAVFRTDTDLKRSAAESRVLLERLVVELSERKRAQP